MNKRLVILTIIADICLLSTLIYYLGILRGGIAFILLCGIGAISGKLLRRKR